MEPPTGSHEWRIEFYRDAVPTRRFVAQLLFFLASRGAVYGGREFPGFYHVFDTVDAVSDKDILQHEDDAEERTEKLGTILDEYYQFDPERTGLTVTFERNCTPNFCFWVGVLPRDGATQIKLETSTNYVSDEATFDAFLDLCRELFVRFNLVYGVYRTEYEETIPLGRRAALEMDPRCVTFYSSGLVEEMGREYVLGAPTDHVEQLEDGGVALVLSTESEVGHRGRSELEAVRRYLSHAWPGENPNESRE